MKWQNDPYVTEVQKAAKINKMLEPFKSTVMPKFVVFLAKKNRLGGIKVIMFEYVQSMYYRQSITPVRVTSAQRLTEDQLTKIKEKMKGKTQTEIKLIEEVDPNLIGGLTLEWGYTDPVQLHAPTHGVDLSLKNILNKRALPERCGERTLSRMIAGRPISFPEPMPYASPLLTNHFFQVPMED